MLKNYFTTAIRNLNRYKIYSAINIIGLAIGMVACLLIYLFVEYEHYFDRFHPKAEQICRLNPVETSRYE